MDVQTFFINTTLVGCILLLTTDVQSLRLTNMTAPRVADVRDDLDLYCHFDMGAEDLYAVKWYKDDHEFFRYKPEREPPTITFPVSGVQMVQQATNCGANHCKVRLTALTRERSSGAYRCEVCSEAPAFRIVSETHNVTVAALPREEPRITGISDFYSLGDTLSIECTSAAADPTPVIVWHVNDEPAQRANLLDERRTAPGTRTVGLRLLIERPLLQRGGALHLRCETSQPGIPAPPQNVGRTIIVKLPPTQVNNEKLHWPSSSAHTKTITIIVPAIALLFSLSLSNL